MDEKFLEIYSDKHLAYPHAYFNLNLSLNSGCVNIPEHIKLENDKLNSRIKIYNSSTSNTYELYDVNKPHSLVLFPIVVYLNGEKTDKEITYREAIAVCKIKRA